MCHNLQKLICFDYSIFVVALFNVLPQQLHCLVECSQRSTDKHTRIRPVVATSGEENTRETEATILPFAIDQPGIMLKPLVLERTPTSGTIGKSVFRPRLEMVSEQVIPLTTTDSCSDETRHIITLCRQK